MLSIDNTLTRQSKWTSHKPKNKWLIEELEQPEGFGVFDWYSDSDY